MDISDKYIAGFFDGEGCITSQLTWKTGKYEKHPRVAVQVTLSQNTQYVLELIRGKYNGTIHYKCEGRKRPCYHLRITGKENMSKFLNAIYPYTVVKKEQIKFALEFLDTVREENLGCVALSEKVHELRKDIHEKLRVLK